MVKRLGIGEYERTDLGIPASVWHLRDAFLSKLHAKKPELFSTCLLLVDPARNCEGHENSSSQEYSAVLSAVLSAKAGTTLPAFQNTTGPFQPFVEFILAQSDVIEQRAAVLMTYFPTRSPASCERLAIYELFGSLQEISLASESEELCRELQSWATTHNLLDDWILEIPLSAMTSYFVALKHDTSLDHRSPENPPIATLEYYLKSVVGESVGYALRNFREIHIPHNLALQDHNWAVPVFPFEFDGYLFGPLHWLPYYEKRESFLGEAQISFQKERDKIFEQVMQSLNFESVRRILEPLRPYFADETKRSSRGYFVVDEIHCVIPPDYELCLIPAGYEFESFNQLVSDAEAQYESRITKIRESAKSRELSLYRKFSEAIGKYCDRIKRERPKHYQRTPAKHNLTHLDWLIEYQFHPTKSYSTIANAQRIQEEVFEPTVRGAVGSIARELQLTLRAPQFGPKKLINSST